MWETKTSWANPYSISNTSDEEVADELVKLLERANNRVTDSITDAFANGGYSQAFGASNVATSAEGSYASAVADNVVMKAVDKILDEKGYPEFDEILKYYLDAHPEYKL